MRVTANQVTLSRLVLMPLLGGMLYGSHDMRVAAVVLGTIIGVTDTLDGYLARKYGPTVLGGLMDPIADKVFIAIGFLPFADLGWAPWWLVAVLFLREFLITALRSSFEQRHRQLKTSYLAKMKTWVQMAAIGMLLLTITISSRTVMLSLLVAGVIGGMVSWLIWRLVKGHGWIGAPIFSGWFSLALVLFLAGGHQWLIYGLFTAVVGMTWVSGLDYMAVGARVLAGGLRAFDAARLLGATALPFVAVAALAHAPTPAWAVIAIVSIELAHGGLDNLLAHHAATEPTWAWSARVLGVTALLGAALLAPAQAFPLTLAALAVSVVGTAEAFIRKRRFYLEEKLREQKLVA